MENPESLWRNFVIWADTHLLVIACRKCGSSFLDAGLPSTQLHCCACGATTHFDDERFTGLRISRPFEGLDENQKRLLFEKLGHDFGRIGETIDYIKNKDLKEGDNHHDLLNALNNFLSRFSEISSKLNNDTKVRMDLKDIWEDAKARIDISVEEILKER